MIKLSIKTTLELQTSREHGLNHKGTLNRFLDGCRRPEMSEDDSSNQAIVPMIKGRHKFLYFSTKY